jgi:hypothetical protein
VLLNDSTVAGELLKSELVFLDGSVGFSVLGDVSHELLFDWRDGGDGANEGEGKEGLHLVVSDFINYKVLNTLSY